MNCSSWGDGSGEGTGDLSEFCSTENADSQQFCPGCQTNYLEYFGVYYWCAHLENPCYLSCQMSFSGFLVGRKNPWKLEANLSLTLARSFGWDKSLSSLQCPSLFERHWSQMNNQGAGYNKLSRDSFVHWGANVWGLKDVFCWSCVLHFWSNVCAPNHVQIALMLFYPLVACFAVISMAFMSILWMLLLKGERLQVGWIPRDTRWLKPRNSQVQSFGHDVMAKAMGPCCNMSGSQSKQKLIRCLLRCVFLLEMSLKTDVCQVQ